MGGAHVRSALAKGFHGLAIALLGVSIAPPASAVQANGVAPAWQIGRSPEGDASAVVAGTWGGVCAGEFVEPGYSASNRTLHWGGEQSCTSPVEQSLRMSLYRVVGTGDFQHDELVESDTAHVVGWQVYVQKHHDCSSVVKSRWTENVYGEADGHLSVPYPAWSSIVTAPCY